MITIATPTRDPIRSWMQDMLHSCAGVDRIVICDDASTDFNPGALRFPAGVDFTFMRNEENLGCFQTINRIIDTEIPDGWISAQADDDYFDKKTFPEILAVLKKTDADVVYFPCEYFGHMMGIFGAAPKIEFKTLYMGNYVYGASFFRREVWEYLGGFQLEVAADWDFWIRALKSGFKFEYFPKVGAHFRVSARSMFEDSLKTMGRANIDDMVRKNVDKWNKKK